MRLLITGGLGFIGSNFIRFTTTKLKDTFIENIDNLSYGSNIENLKDLRRNANYRFVRGDVVDTNRVTTLLKNADAVINFAAESHVDRSISNARPFVNSNIVGVYSILEALRVSESEATMIQIGTDEEYGERLQGSFSESDCLKPSSPYAATKASASMLVMAYHKTYGLKTIVTRCTNNLGPYQSPEKLVPKTIIRALRGHKVPLYGSGNNVRDWIYVQDHCEAILRVLKRGKSGDFYNISSGNEMTNIEVVTRILEIVGKSRELIEPVGDRPGHDFRYSLDSTKIRKELGWKPRFDFEDALRRTIQWYKDNEGWWRPLAEEKLLSAEPWNEKW